MKHIIFFFLSLTLNSAFSQKTRIENNKVIVDGQHWCNITESRGSSKLKTLKFKGKDGAIWMQAIPKTVNIADSTLHLYQLNFIALNRIIYFKPGIGSIKTLASQLVVSRAFIKSGIYAPGIDKFEKNYAFPLPDNLQLSNGKNIKSQVTLVERNLDANIFVLNGKITQDFKLVASYISEKVIIENETYDLIKFTDIKGLQIAQAEISHTDKGTAFLYFNGK